MPSCFIPCLKLKNRKKKKNQQHTHQEKAWGRWKEAFFAGGGQRQPSPAEVGGLWLLAAHYVAFKLRLFLLEEERENWAEPVPLPLYGLHKHVFAGWQPRLSWLQRQHMCKGKIMVLTGGLWGKHLHNPFVRWQLVQLSSGFT